VDAVVLQTTVEYHLSCWWHTNRNKVTVCYVHE